MMVEMELVIQSISAEYIFYPVSAVLVSKSIFDFISFRKLSPNDNTKITGVGHTYWSKT